MTRLTHDQATEESPDDLLAILASAANPDGTAYMLPVDVRGDKTIKFARINATADGDNVVVAAVAGKKIQVLAYAVSVSAAGTISFQDTAGTPGVLAQFALAQNGGASFAGTIDAPAFETPAGLGLEINCPVGVDALGHLAYIEA